MSLNNKSNHIKLLGALDNLFLGKDGIYGMVPRDDHQVTEVDMRDQLARMPIGDLFGYISRSHSFPVMDYEVSCYLKKIPVNGTVIDIGGCWGWHWRDLESKRPDVSVVIVDFVRSNLLRAKGLLGSSKKIYLVHGDAKSLTFPADTFDGVWTVQTFQHIPDFESAVRESYRVLKFGGEFANYSLNMQPPLRFMSRALRRNYIDEGWVPEMYWLSRASSSQKKIIEKIFMSSVKERWSEIIYTPEIGFWFPGKLHSMIGFVDKYLSNNLGIFGWLARQRSFHCVKT
jgi:ubiquinone/menaquinone biosynthesis C-methylase UbiE